MKSGTITFSSSTTKGKLKTRVVDIQPTLAELLADYQPSPGPLFPGLRGVTEQMTRFAADKILRNACAQVGLVGVK